MNILSKVTWQAMWKNKTRTIVTIIGIILSAAMFTAVTTLGYSLWSYLLDIQVYNSGDYFLRYDYTSDAHLEELKEDGRISNLGDLQILGFTTFRVEQENGYVSEESCMVAAGDDAFFNMITVNLEEGRLPQTSNEIVITRNIYYYLLDNGMSPEVGDTIELTVAPECPEELGIEIPYAGSIFTKSYTIVGISERFTRLSDSTVYMSHLFTYADGKQEETVWHRAYVKTAIPMDAYDMLDEAPDGAIATNNEDILALHGATKYANYNTLIVAICAVLMAIIMVGSVSLIYNAFSISVSERTKQFGLLSSIGSTRKQLRHSIFFEALVLSVFGIPVGLLCGYFGISLTLNLLSTAVDSLFDASSIGVTMRAIPSALAFTAAGIVALLTVLISAWIPAKRATRVSPLSAIRQAQDYQIPKRGLKPNKLTVKIWGLPGLMAKKYYTVSKKKYRATIVSLAISIILFISAFTVGQSLRVFANSTANTNNFDIMLYDVSDEEISEIRALEAVNNSALWINRSYVIELPQADQSADYWKDCQMVAADRNISMTAKNLSVFYLEDAVFLEYLNEQGIDPEPYFHTECPSALVMKSKTNEYIYDSKKDIHNKVTHISDVFAEGVEYLTVYPHECPKAVTYYIESQIGSAWRSLSSENIVAYDFFYSVYSENSVSVSEEKITVQVVREKDENGTVSFSYYLYDPETGTRVETPIYTQTQSEDIPAFKLGASIEELPYGIETSSMSDPQTVKIILPLSAAGKTDEDDQYLSVSVNNREVFLDYINSSAEGFTITDYLDSEIMYRNLILMIDVFSYGFIILISLICVANVFNTISTNIALRRRDFGMLRSVGMKTNEIYRMMSYECLIYGSRALLWGLPIATVISYFFQWLDRDTTSGKYAPPWAAITIATVCVFIVVFASMFYAVAKLRKDNPIDAIRMENT